MRHLNAMLLFVILPCLAACLSCGAGKTSTRESDPKVTGHRETEHTQGPAKGHGTAGDGDEGEGGEAVVFIDRTDDYQRDPGNGGSSGGGYTDDDRDALSGSETTSAPSDPARDYSYDSPDEPKPTTPYVVEESKDDREVRRHRRRRHRPNNKPKPEKKEDSGGSYGSPHAGGAGDASVRTVDQTGATTISQPTHTKVAEPEAEDKQVADTPNAVAVGPTGVPAVQVWKDKANWTEFELAVNEVGPVYTEPGDLPQLEIVFVDDIVIQDFVDEYNIERTWNGKITVPLEHTHVDAVLSGPIGRVHVQQRYNNPFKKPIEAIYVFPLPENSAVDGMRMVIGERVIEGVVREREEARKMYEEAKAAGHVAALLEQERPNVFTQSVANIPPGQRINIDIRYVQDLTYDAGVYEFVFPMVVGPRYVPGSVGEGARVTPPVIGAGTRSGHDISLTVAADAGMPIRSFEVPTHETEGALDASGRLTARLAQHDTIPNRDFVMRYAVAGEQPQIAVLSERDKDTKEGYFTLIVQPPEADVNALIGTRQMVFVVDVSGSMAGVPLAMSQEVMVESLRRLRPVDTFNIITFASGAQRLFDGARPANRKNIERGVQFVEDMEAGGGTRMLGGVTEALTEPLEPGMQRVVVFMTDGFIGNEDQVLTAIGDGVKAIEEKNAKARVFAMGVGSSTNRYLIDGLAREGDGAAVYALNREDPRKAVDTFFRVIDHPILTDVEIDWGTLDVDVETTYPSKAPDLMASRPLILHGKYGKAGKGRAVLKARSRGELMEVSFDVNLEKDQAHDGLLGTLWARSAVEQLQRDLLYSSDYYGVRNEIVRLGTAHNIVTKFTSFVAIDSSEVVEGGGNPMRVDQPVERPEDTQR